MSETLSNTEKLEIIEKNSHDVSWWVKIIDAAVSMPGVCVDREEFLRKELNKKVSPELIDAAVKYGTIEAGIPKEIADKIAKNNIKSKTALATAVSFGTGLPGGFAGLLGGAAVDLAQFFGNFFNLAQKLMYIYGYRDISELDCSQTDIMLVMLGTASGVEIAQKFIAKGIPVLADKLIIKITEKSLFKTISDRVLITLGKKGAAMFTKAEITKIIGGAVPIVGGGLSAVLTYIMFKPMAKTLNKYLSESYNYKASENDIIEIINSSD